MTFKKWILERYDSDDLRDIAHGGCVSGSAHGAIYYHETTALYDKWHEEIWDKLGEIMESLDSENPLELIASFMGSKNVYSDHTFKNLLVWFYIEEVARMKTDKEPTDE